MPEIAVSADSADGTEPIGDPPDFVQYAADVDNGGDYGAPKRATDVFEEWFFKQTTLEQE